MHAFDYVTVLLSFVYAAAIVHILTTVGDLILASRRVRFSWLNPGWMLASLFATLSGWISTWDLRENASWSMPAIGLNFIIACGFYLLTRLVSPRVPENTAIDLIAFHAENGRKYLAASAALSGVSIGLNVYFGQMWGVAEFVEQNAAVIPIALAAGAAAIWIRNRPVQVAALMIEIAMWLWYYGTLQGALTG